MTALAFKAHVTSSITTVTTSAWTSFSGFSEVTSETLGGVIELNADTATFDILQDGFYHFGGCVHFQNNTGGPFTDLVILTRLFDGTNELRCSQRNKVIPAFADGAEDVLSYNGTASLSAGDAINLQYFTDNSGLDFIANSNFLSGVVATFWAVRDGSKA